jgi:hypothetical protein
MHALDISDKIAGAQLLRLASFCTECLRLLQSAAEAQIIPAV